MPALAADASMRDQFFENMRNVDRRRREPWVIEALRYANHPLRSDHARKYIRPGLDLLVEIRRTGDIFFPRNWMDALLSGHNSPEAAETVREFLRESPDYPVRLRQIIQQSADLLFRASGSSSVGDASRDRKGARRTTLQGRLLHELNTYSTIRITSTSSVILIQLHGRSPAILPVAPLTSTWYDLA